MKKILIISLLGILFATQTTAQQDISVTNNGNIQAEVTAIYKYNGNGLQYIWDVTNGGQVDYYHPYDPNYVLVEFVIKGDLSTTGNYNYGLDNSDTFGCSTCGGALAVGYYDAGTQVLDILD